MSEAVALAAEPTGVLPTAREYTPTLCRTPGCENLATRSDAKCHRHSRFRAVASVMAEEVNEQLRSHAPEAVDCVVEAMRAGAKEGDHKAAAWLLTHSGVVKPVGPSSIGGGEGTKLVVQVGIILPGLPGAKE